MKKKMTAYIHVTTDNPNDEHEPIILGEIEILHGVFQKACERNEVKITSFEGGIDIQLGRGALNISIFEDEGKKPRPKSERDCGECEPCIFEEYRDDDPSTHCVKCTCIFCIPGS